MLSTPRASYARSFHKQFFSSNTKDVSDWGKRGTSEERAARREQRRVYNLAAQIDNAKDEEEGLRFTPEQFQTLLQTFIAVKTEFSDLDDHRRKSVIPQLPKTPQRRYTGYTNMFSPTSSPAFLRLSESSTPNKNLSRTLMTPTKFTLPVQSTPKASYLSTPSATDDSDIFATPTARRRTPPGTPASLLPLKLGIAAFESSDILPPSKVLDLPPFLSLASTLSTQPAPTTPQITPIEAYGEFSAPNARRSFKRSQRSNNLQFQHSELEPTAPAEPPSKPDASLTEDEWEDSLPELSLFTLS